MILKYTLKITLFLTLSSCTQVAYWVYGVHKPKPLSLEQMKEKYSKMGLSEYYVLALKDTVYYDFLAKSSSVNSVLIFNNQNHNLKPIDEFTCTSDRLDFLSNYKNSSISKIDSSFNLDFMDKVVPVFNNSQNSKIDSEINYTVILTFADFVGKLKEKTTFEHIKKYHSLKDSQSQLILIALDPLKLP